ATTHHRVGVVVIATTVCAGAHGDHPARFGHLVIHLAQRRCHLVAQRASHNHHVGLTRRWTENNTETVQIVTRRTRMHHLNGTAGQTERHWPHRTGTSPVEQLVGRGGNKSFVQYAFNRHSLIPIQGS